jgi:hypothetical protein
MFDREIFDEARKEFLSHLRYTRGHSPRTCYSLPNSYPHIKMNKTSILLSNFHRVKLKLFDLVEERNHESGVDV